MSLVTITNEGRVRILSLNRPDQRNALNAAIRTELMAAVDAASHDDSVGAIVLTGTGKCFAAGADLNELQARNSEQQRQFLQPPHIYSTIEEASKPVIAAINGHALGAGLELATACDIRIAAPTAKLGQPEIHLALLPGGGGTQRLVRLLGRGKASQLVMTGEAIDAPTAHAWGLVDAVADDTVQAAVAMAQLMARHDSQAVAEAKAALHAAVTEPYDDGLRVEIDHFVLLHGRAEAQKRIAAFLER